MKVIIQRHCAGHPFYLAYTPGNEAEVSQELGEQLVAAGIATQVPEKPATKPAAKKTTAKKSTSKD